MDQTRIKRVRRHKRAGQDCSFGSDITIQSDESKAGDIARPVVSQQEVLACSPIEPFVVGAVRSRSFGRSFEARVIANVSYEDIEVGVEIVIANGEAHPRANLIDSHFGFNRRKSDAF